MADISRRWFIGGATAFGALSGCRAFRALPGAYAFGAPKLRFGIITDTHMRITDDGLGVKPELCRTNLLKAFRWFDAQGVDAVMIAGDMTDVGHMIEMRELVDAWQMVFPDDRAADGRKVERLFVMGNHDWEGSCYSLYAPNIMQEPGEFDKGLLRCNIQRHWEELFNEPWSEVWHKTVKGYDFVGAHWCGPRRSRGVDEEAVVGVTDWFNAHAKELDPDQPMFYVQHPHPKGTCYGDWAWGHDDGRSTRELSKFPNAVAFSGHSHYSLTDERSIWQGAFTSLGCGSLAFTGMPVESCPDTGYDNIGCGPREVDQKRATPRYVHGDQKQGVLVSVWDDRIVFGRQDFAAEAPAGDDWVMPLPAAEGRPFSFAEHARKSVAPQFAESAKITVTRRMGNYVGGEPWDVLKVPVVRLRIPPAFAARGARAFEIEVVTEIQGGAKDVRKLLAVGFNKAPTSRLAHTPTECFIPTEGFAGKRVRFSACPISSLGLRGKPLITDWLDFA